MPLAEKETVHVWHSQPIEEVVQKVLEESGAGSSSAAGLDPEPRATHKHDEDDQAEILSGGEQEQEEQQQEQEEQEEEEAGSSSESDEVLAEVLARVREMILLDSKPQPPPQPQKSPLKSLDLAGIADYIKSGLLACPRVGTPCCAWAGRARVRAREGDCVQGGPQLQVQELRGTVAWI